MTNTTLATQAAAEAREFTIEYDAKLSDEMRVVCAWFGSWAGWVSSASRLNAIDGLAGATPWACARADHGTQPAVTDYPDGIHRCRWCYINDAAIRRSERDLPIMAPAIEEPGPTVMPPLPQYDEDWPPPPPTVEKWWTTYPEGGPDRIGTAAREARAEIGGYLDCGQADVTSDVSSYARVAWPFKPAEGEAEQMAAGEWPTADAIGVGFVTDYKTTPPLSWTDMPPLSRRQRWWFAATDALADFWRALVKPRLSLLFVIAVLLMSAFINAVLIGHRTTTIVVAPRPPMTCTPTSPGSDTLRCQAADQP